MKRIIYAPAAALAVIIFFIIELITVAVSSVLHFIKDVDAMCRELPNEFKNAYDEFLEM